MTPETARRNRVNGASSADEGTTADNVDPANSASAVPEKGLSSDTPTEPHSRTEPPSGASVERVGGLRVLNVRGSFYEMGYQHGSLLADDVRVGPLIYFRTYIERTLARSHLGPFAPIVWPTVQKVLAPRVAKTMPEFAAETLRGLADGADLPFREIMDGATMPDTFLWLAAKFMRLNRIGPAVHHRLALGLGCTSAIAWDDATSDGRLLHARNLDYHGVSSWPSTATLAFHTPDDGMRYVSACAAGVPLGGGTAMNEAGLTLTVHQHMFTDQTQFGGVAIGIVGDEVMRKAETLADAERILGSVKPIGCWTYLIADGKCNELLCWEENPNRKIAIRVPRQKQMFGYSNIYLDSELGATEIDLYGSYWRHNRARYERAHSMLRERSGPLTPQEMASILGDPGHPDCRISAAIGMLMTVASVVFRPEDGVVWLASGEAPTSQRPFLPFSFDRMGYAPEHGTLPGASPGTADAAKAFESYRLAYLAYTDDWNLSAARRHLNDATAKQPEQPLYHLLAGLVALKCADAPAAADSLDTAIALGHPDEERVAAFHLWRGRSADIVGDREGAKRYYRGALGRRSDPPVRTAALRGLRRRFSARSARGVNIDFTFADVVTP